MNENKKDFKTWVKAHKKEIIIFFSGAILATIAWCLIKNNWDEIKALWDSLREKVDNNSLPEKMKSYSSVDIDDSDDEIADWTDSFSTSEDINDFESIMHEPFDVCGHTRSLPEGWKASEEKIATAKEYGYDLLENQTWVKPYRKYNQIA